MDHNSHLQTIDFSPFSVEKDEIVNINRDELEQVAQQLIDGLTNHGFVYIRNHGIQKHEIDGVFSVSDSFFGLSEEIKSKYHVNEGLDKHGYVPINGELLGRDTRRKEFRECFNVTQRDAFSPKEEECPGFTAAVDGFFTSCSFLALRILRAIAIALKLEDEKYFSETHLPMDTMENFTTLRLLNYPPIKDGDCESEDGGSIRCGEHSDYGTITLLFQDETGGLEVKTRNGDYLQVKPVPETIIVNVGNILEHMTAGQLLAARHRVLLDGLSGQRRRQSIAFFVHPVHDTMVQRMQGPKDENPLSAYDFVKKNFDETYNI